MAKVKLDNISATFTLNNGQTIPVLGLGTWEIYGKDVIQPVKSALALGYRHIDTAKWYENEKELGQAVRESGLPRESIYVTTKLHPADHGFDSCYKAFHECLNNLGLEYIDLFLIHWPGLNDEDKDAKAVYGDQTAKARADSWRAMEKIIKEGKCKAIGVSNYTISHLQELLAHCVVPPAVNQFELHPCLYQKDLVDFCQKNNILVQAYCSLMRGQLLDNPTIKSVATKHNKTPAQVLLRWGLQHDAVVIPKSTSETRIKENSDLFDFEITQDEMNSIDALHNNTRLEWDPTTIV
eukprot:TRINITY_DN1661_c0_g1_i1.p1 TRINITY_DN1661_c0_g1~~TRINITY_DN1661_c0_g1_i1.p1  ORF type:complete len:295 (-),score=64.15 TRINITY_DN1661_c0_g1_i1:107-991(-)